ncbi:MAG: rolling circle replication-associated protein [bacterium]
MAARPGRWLYFVTLTAPGENEHALPGGRLCDCTPRGGVDLARWNASHSACWNRFRTWLAEVVPGVEFIRGVEVQGRGALHDHVIVDSPVPLPLKRWLPEMRRRAIMAGYGHSIDVAPITSPKQVAYYISKYITKACDVRESVPWWGQQINYQTGELTEGLTDASYRTWSSSRKWGFTMSDAKAASAAFAQRKLAQIQEEALGVLNLMLGAVPVVPDPPPF